MKTILILTLFALISSTSFAAKKGISYDPDDLISGEVHSQALDEPSVFDEVRLHVGALFVNSFQDFAIAPGIRERGGIRGFGFNFGVDLFSPNWVAQGVLINFPEAQISDTRMSSTGFELRLLYETAIIEALTFQGGIGIANRNYMIKTKARGDGSVGNTETSFSSGATVLTAGLEYWVNPQVGGGLAVSNHLPMANGDEPNSIDLTVSINGHF